MDNFSLMQLFVFVMLSAVLVFVSWPSFRNVRSHGFYRFFAWEAILVLFLLNAKFWFYEPFAWNQILAWTLLVLSLIPLALGVRSLRSRGKPVDRREGDPSLLAFEKTTALVTSGIYRYIRHPLYSSLFFLTWGIFFKYPFWLAAVLSGVSTLFIVLTAKADETECLQFFGSEYAQYMKHTKRFVPYIF